MISSCLRTMGVSFSSLLISLILASASLAVEAKALVTGPTLRGSGETLAMLIQVRVVNADGTPARDVEFVAQVERQRSLETLAAKIDQGKFRVWVPVSGSDWQQVQLAATAKDGSSTASTHGPTRVVKAISNVDFRQAAIEGLELQLAPTNRATAIAVTHEGAPVANAHVNARLLNGLLLNGKSDRMGKVSFLLREDEKLQHLTAWTDDFRIGGYSLGRRPPGLPSRDPLGDTFKIELGKCRDQVFRFVNEDNNSPVPDVDFQLSMRTGPPKFDYVAVPRSFPHCQNTTDKDGEATNRWIPTEEGNNPHLEIVDPDWVAGVSSRDMTTADDGALVMPIKRRVTRKPLVGSVKSLDGFNVGGLLIQMKSHQGEEKGRFDVVYVFTDKNGKFTGDCIPGSRYTVCVNDRQLVSEMIDLVPYDPDTKQSHPAELNVATGNLIEIHVTSGKNKTPMPNRPVFVRQEHAYEWTENGKTASGSSARDSYVITNEEGIAYSRALPGSFLQIGVEVGEWRTGRKLTVKEDGVTLVEFQRQVDED